MDRRFESFDGIYLPERPESIWGLPLGTFWYGETKWGPQGKERTYKSLWCVLPHGTFGGQGIEIKPSPGKLPIAGDYPKDGASWSWDGNVEKPTLGPSSPDNPHSILCRASDGTTTWHGYLVGGRFEACE